MRMPRFRITIGRLMVALAIAVAAETLMARWAVANAREDGPNYELGDAITNWALLHVPLAFVAFLMWVGYHPEKQPDPPETK